MHVFEKARQHAYDIIVGRDLLQNLGIDVLNSKKAFLWSGIEIKMV